MEREHVVDAGVIEHLTHRFFFQAEDGIRDLSVNGVQTCALPILSIKGHPDAIPGWLPHTHCELVLCIGGGGLGHCPSARPSPGCGDSWSGAHPWRARGEQRAFLLFDSELHGTRTIRALPDGLSNPKRGRDDGSVDWRTCAAVHRVT